MACFEEPTLTSFQQVAADYRQAWLDEVDKEQDWFGLRCKNLAEAIARASMSEVPTGKGKRLRRHSHQTRIPREVLVEAKHELLKAEGQIIVTQNFAELHAVVDHTIRAIPGVGPLLVYDIAHRIGSYLKLEPEEVYLHAGTRSGAKSIGLDVSRVSIPLNEFPEGLRSLSASQLEDVLCIYCQVLARIHSANSSVRQRSLRRC